MSEIIKILRESNVKVAKDVQAETFVALRTYLLNNGISIPWDRNCPNYQNYDCNIFNMSRATINTSNHFHGSMNLDARLPRRSTRRWNRIEELLIQDSSMFYKPVKLP